MCSFRNPLLLSRMRDLKDAKRDGSSTFPPFFLSTSLLHTFLSEAKSLPFPETEISYKRGERGKKKKNSASFLCFSYKWQLSLTLPLHSHPYTLRAFAVSKSTAKYHMGPPNLPHFPLLLPIPHILCPPGCLSNGLCGINELIHTEKGQLHLFATQSNVNKP